MWIMSPVFIADYLLYKDLSFLCWSWRDYFCSCQCQHNMPAGYWGSWISINFFWWCCSWLLALFAWTRESSSWRNFTGGVSFGSLESMLGSGQVNLWPEELVRKRMGKSSRWTLIWSLLQLFLVDWKLLLADWASALSPHSSLIGHSCGTSVFARKWTGRCCLWFAVCTLGYTARDKKTKLPLV